jgi:hypothetical protein
MPNFPLQDQPLVLPSGRIVRVYNLLSLTQHDDPTSLLRIEPTFRIQYQTGIDPDQAAERAAEAAEIIAYFLGDAAVEPTMVAYAEICSTPAKAERRDPPEISFRFCRADNGSWRLVGSNRSLDHPPNER